MDSIWGSSVLLRIYLVALLFYSIIVYVLFPYDKTEKHNREVTQTDHTENAISIKSIVQAICACILFIVGFFFAIKVDLIRWFIFSISYIFFFIVFSYSLTEFIRSIFINPSRFILVPANEKIMGFIGVVSYLICSGISRGTAIQLVPQFLLSSPFSKDIIYFILIISWYSFVLFFDSALIILTLHHIVIKIPFLAKPHNFTSPLRYNESILNFCAVIDKWLISLPRVTLKQKFTCAIYKKIWFLLKIPAIVFEVIINSIYMILSLSLTVLAKTFSLFIRKTNHALRTPPEKTILVLSRLSFVLSFIIVYIIDRYQEIFSPSGSDVYEFTCSVILIPFLITELSKIRKKSSP